MHYFTQFKIVINYKDGLSIFHTVRILNRYRQHLQSNSRCGSSKMHSQSTITKNQATTVRKVGIDISGRTKSNDGGGSCLTAELVSAADRL